MRSRVRIVAPPMPALAAIDVALWDLAGRRAGMPLWMLLGGGRDRVPSTTPTSAGSIGLWAS